MNETGMENWDEVIEDIRSGDTDRYREIIERFQPLIRFVVSYYFRGRPDQTDEIVHITFLEAYRGLARFETGRPLEAWLKGIARRQSMRALRALARENAASENLIQLELARTRENTDPPLECAERLSACMDRLKSFARELVELHYFQRVSLKSIATRLSRSAESLRVTMLRIRTQLRACLTETVES